MKSRRRLGTFGISACAAAHCKVIKDYLTAEKMQMMADNNFSNLSGPPASGKLPEYVIGADDFDQFIRGWTKYWNDIFKPEEPLDPDLVRDLAQFKDQDVNLNLQGKTLLFSSDPEVSLKSLSFDTAVGRRILCGCKMDKLSVKKGRLEVYSSEVREIGHISGKLIKGSDSILPAGYLIFASVSEGSVPKPSLLLFERSLVNLHYLK